ncbi:MAG: vancomycin high temperature exclusion protein [Anaerovoracaceae bacterium]
MGKILKRIFIIILAIIIAFLIFIGYTNYRVISSEKGNIAASITSSHTELSSSETSRIKKLDAQCAIVLGAGIINSTTPSPMLKNRLDAGIMLYKKGLVKKILLSGDNGTVEHNELHVMLYYTKKAGVPAEDIFCDHAGFSTYETFCRAKSVFKVKRAVVVTQSYHLTRALYDADSKGIECLGVASDQKVYSGQKVRDLREVGARTKDFVDCARNAAPTYGGDPIPITGSGVSSHGE